MAAVAAVSASVLPSILVGSEAKLFEVENIRYANKVFLKCFSFFHKFKTQFFIKI